LSWFAASAQLLDDLVRSVEQYLLNHLRNAGDLVVPAGLSLRVVQLFGRAIEEAERDDDVRVGYVPNVLDRTPALDDLGVTWVPCGAERVVSAVL
jgi:hypothetical protein